MFGIPIPSVWLIAVAGSAVILLGIAYVLQAGRIADDFKLVLIAHRRILIMALVSLGLTLCFIGALLIFLAVVEPKTGTARTVSLACAAMLCLLAVWTGSTGARSEYLLLRMSHIVKIVAAAMVLSGNLSG
jgi:hypothetical protein